MSPKRKSNSVSSTVEIVNELGMHARAAAKFVKTASGFDAGITIEKGEQRVNGKSIMGILMLAAGIGSKITIHAEGPEAESALEALAKLVASGFGELPE